jgi:uncharacterized membrane protein
MTLFFQLFIAHFLGDFVLQPNSWVEHKECKKWRSAYLYGHSIVHLALLFVLTFRWELWAYFGVLALSHLLIDGFKLMWQSEGNKTKWFFADQILHAMSIFLVYVWAEESFSWLSGLYNDVIWIYLMAGIVLLFVFPVMIRKILQPWTQEIELAEQHSEEIQSDNTSEKSLKKAGTYIGILERVFVFIFVLSGQWQAVGFLIAAKSVFRFGDLQDAKNRKLTEYVLIGTLISFGSAFLLAMICEYFLSLA